MEKLRVKYRKTGKLRWLSQLDILRTIERGLRRANFPIAFSQGFSPHPKISFSPALPVGIGSQAEYFDIELLKTFNPTKFKSSLNMKLPPDLQVESVSKLPLKYLSLGKLSQYSYYKLKYSLDNLTKNNFLTSEIKRINSIISNQGDIIEIKKIDINSENTLLSIYLICPTNTSLLKFIHEISPNKIESERLEQYYSYNNKLVELNNHTLLWGDNEGKP